jgi:MoaA/NifB/PqqE/SkfB family radical SAM enzyme
MRNTSYYDSRELSRNYAYDNNFAPTRAVLVLTNKCNLSCDFCFQERKSLDGQMSLDDWKAVLKKLPKGSHVTLTGGEPLAYKYFDEIFNIAAEKFTVNVITNGVLLNDRVIELFLSKENFLELSISIDTIGNYNRDVKPIDYQNMVGCLSRFKERKKQTKSNSILSTKTVITNENTLVLYDIYKHVIEVLHAESHSFQFLKGSPIQHADRMVDINRIYDKPPNNIYTNISGMAKEFEKISLYVKNNQLKCFSHPGFIDFSSDNQNFLDVLKKHINKSNFLPENYQKCKGPWESAHINADGKVFSCLACSLGDIRDFDSWSKLFESEKAVEFRGIIKSEGTVPACNMCGYLKVM